MAVLQKIRGWGIILSILIALPLLLFVIDPSQVMDALNILSDKNNVGTINGKSIPYTDFQRDVERFKTVNEVMNGTSTQTEQQQEQIRNAAWQSLVDKYLFVKNARAAGISVGNEEMQDLLSGDMKSPIITSNPAFMDENGSFSKEALLSLIDNISRDASGRLKEYWNYIQNTVYTQQFHAKYNALFTQSNVQTPLMLSRSISENNSTTNVDFVLVPSTYAPDTAVVVSDSEIRNFYESHKKMFKQNASRDIEYVVFEVKPSREDVAATHEAISSVYE